MQVKREQDQPKRRRFTLLGIAVSLTACALLTGAIACATIFLLNDTLVGRGLELAGFESEGRTADVLEAEADISSMPIPQIVQPTQPAQFRVSAGAYGSEQIVNDAGASLRTGADESGQRMALVTTDEDEMRRLCRQWSQVCEPTGVTRSGYSLRNADIDLQNNSAIVSVEVRPPDINLWQAVGLVLQLDETGNTLRVRGVDINGVLYSQPPAQFAALISEAERVANDALRQLIVDAVGQQYTLESITVNNDSVTLLLR